MNIETAKMMMETHKELLEIIKMELKMEKDIYKPKKKPRGWFEFAFILKAKLELSNKTAIERIY